MGIKNLFCLYSKWIISRHPAEKFPVVTAAHDLSADEPLIIGTMGHAVVLSGLIYTSNGVQTIINSAQAYDPWPGRGLK